MNINIFGVGRSGTTGLQIYLSYLIAQQEGTARINSEPYIWQTRKGPLCFYGQKMFLDSEILLDRTSKLTHEHEQYLKRLVDGNTSVVNKFIRGNGLIYQINAITKPDLTFIIYRDIYEVLLSLKKYTWEYTDIYGSYLKKKELSYWVQFKNNRFTKKVINEFGLDIKEIEQSAELRNTLYWYVNNLHTLSYEGEAYQIYFPDISLVESILTDSEFNEIPPIKNAIFFGDNLNKNFPLQDVSSRNKAFNYLITKFDNISFYLERKYKISSPYLLKNCGSIVNIAEDANQLAKHSHKPTSNTSKKEYSYHAITKMLRTDLLDKLELVRYRK